MRCWSLWYEPTLTSLLQFVLFSFSLANDILKDSEPGSFIIRDSQSFPGAFGLAVKVAVPPAHVLQGLQGDLSKLEYPSLLKKLRKDLINILQSTFHSSRSICLRISLKVYLFFPFLTRFVERFAPVGRFSLFSESFIMRQFALSLFTLRWLLKKVPMWGPFIAFLYETLYCLFL